MEGIFTAWGRILAGRAPNLSVEITRKCPLTCPGCYAFTDDHIGPGESHRQLSDFKGAELVDEHKPIHVSIVGGEPLVRYRELNEVLPWLAGQGIHTQLVISAARPIPEEGSGLRRLQVVVSIDGLQPEHDAWRTPATYDRILKHIVGHEITVHCTITRQQVQRDGYLEEFLQIWSANPAIKQLYLSLYTPQIGEMSEECLTVADCDRVVEQLLYYRAQFPKLARAMPEELISVYAEPPESPDDCVFAKITTCFSADLEKQVTPCQLGGNPDCSRCGCIASAGLKAVGRHRLPMGIEVGKVFDGSSWVGARVRQVTETVGGR